MRHKPTSARGASWTDIIAHERRSAGEFPTLCQAQVWGKARGVPTVPGLRGHWLSGHTKARAVSESKCLLKHGPPFGFVLVAALPCLPLARPPALNCGRDAQHQAAWW